MPQRHKRTLFGVEYIHLKGRQHGDFFITAQGWAVVQSLQPQHWFEAKRFSKVGRHLLGATGAVFRVPVPHPGRRDFAIVVKFSRFGQSVGVTAVDPRLGLSQEDISRIKAAHFLSPFEEFGNVCKLKAAAGMSIPMKAPLGIYCPSTRFLGWQLGREPYLQSIHDRALLDSQLDVPEADRIRYERERQYILLYRWINGMDAEQAVEAGLISEAQMIALGRDARQTMASLGWEVADHKPRHVILRTARNGQLVTRKDKPLWALIDYELLYPHRRVTACET